MQNTRSLSDAEGERVRARVRAIVRTAGSQSAASKVLDISQQVIGKVLNDGAVGPYVARKVADHLGITFDELIGAKPMPPGTPDPADPYPNRSRFLREPEFLAAPAPVQDRIRQLSQASGDRSMREWFVLLDKLLGLHTDGMLDAATDPRVTPAKPRPRPSRGK